MIVDFPSEVNSFNSRDAFLSISILLGELIALITVALFELYWVIWT